jgi:hypothetical protein
MLAWIVFGLIESLLCGLIFGLIYRDSAEAPKA